MGSKSRKKQRPVIEVPLLVQLAISDRAHGPRQRPAIIRRAWTFTLVSPIAIVAALLLPVPYQGGALVVGLVCILLASTQWLAIRWLDRRHAWHAVRRQSRSTIILGK